MWKSALAGAVALATLGSLNISTGEIGISKAAAQEAVITHGRIVRLKKALRLTPEQIRHWPRVEAVLRGIARRNAQRDADDEGMLTRLRSRTSGYAAQTVSYGHLAAAAQPLINSLRDDQKRAGLRVIRSMGLGSML